MKKTFLSLAAMAALIAVPAFAQKRGDGPPRFSPEKRVERLTTLLNLTASQQGEATAIFANAQAAMEPTFESMRASRKALAAAAKTNDVATISSEAAKIGTFTGSQLEAQTKAEAAFYAMLTDDQRTKYDQLRQDGRRGPGGPRGGRQ